MKIAGLLFLFFLSLYLLTMGEGFYSGDGEVMYRTTWSLVENHTLAIPCDTSFPQGVPGADGRCYSTYGLGQALAAVPLYVTGTAWSDSLKTNRWNTTRFFVSRFNQFITAATVAMVYVFGNSLYASSDLGVSLAFMYGLGTMAWPYSKFYFGQPLTALLLVVAAYGLRRARQEPSWRWVVFAGGALSYALVTRAAVAITLPIFFAYGFLSLRRAGLSWRLTNARMLLCGTAVLPGIGLDLWHNYLRFGNALNFGYPGEGWVTPLYVGLYGLLLSSGKSLFLFVPLAVLAPWGLTRLWASPRRAEAMLFGGVLLIYLVFHAGWWAWHGGWSWGPRFLVPTIPFLVLALGELWTASRTAHRALIALFLVSLYPQLMGVAVDFNLYMLHVNDEPKVLFNPEFSPLVGHLRFLFRSGKLALVDSEFLALGLPLMTGTLFRTMLLGALGILGWKLRSQQSVAKPP